MKITDIKTLVVNAVMRNWVFVKVETDEPGLYGWGEATLEWKTRGVVGCVEDFKPMLLGRDPTRIEFLWQILYRHSFWRIGAIGMTALSGIEQACWDILGKSLGVPVYKLLGGRVRDRVRMYTHLGGGEMKAVYETAEAGPLIERARSVIEKGYSAVKVVMTPLVARRALSALVKAIIMFTPFVTHYEAEARPLGRARHLSQEPLLTRGLLPWK